MPIYAAGPRPATMTLAPTSRRCIKHTLDRYLPLRSSTTKQRNSADPTPQIIARIASGPVSPDSSRAQISIAPARHRPTFPDRGFLPWRLSDAGRRCTWHRRVRPASETLHISHDYEVVRPSPFAFLLMPTQCCSRSLPKHAEADRCRDAHIARSSPPERVQATCR